MTDFSWKRAFVGEVKVKDLKINHPGLSKWDQTPMTSVLVRDTREKKIRPQEGQGRDRRVQPQAILEPLYGLDFLLRLEFLVCLAIAQKLWPFAN